MTPSPSSQASQETPKCLYRPAKQLPYDLRQQCIIYFEEGFYLPALYLLQNLLNSGASSIKIRPAFVPPPSSLALLVTLTVHPSFTTRAKSEDHSTASSLALAYLHALNRTVGPSHANFADAFTFHATSTNDLRRRLRPSRHDDRDRSPSSSSDDVPDAISSPLARRSSLWAAAPDFWHAVGWAFNCSVRHPARWAHWHLWLTYMLRVLSDDWQARTTDGVAESLLVAYLAAAGSERRVVRALFADGSDPATREFGEVWKGETRLAQREKKEQPPPTRSKVVRIDDDDYGDYEQQSSDDNGDLDSATVADPISLDPNLILGGIISVQLRINLLQLIHDAITNDTATTAASFSPTTVWDALLNAIIPLPFPTFAHLLTLPRLLPLTGPPATGLLQSLACTYIATNAPTPPASGLNQTSLEQCYLPFGAHAGVATEGGDARLAVCVEGLLRAYHHWKGLLWSPELESCVERGIAQRAKATATATTVLGKGARKRRGVIAGGSGDGALERAWMEESAVRMRSLVQEAKERALGCD